MILSRERTQTEPSVVDSAYHEMMAGCEPSAELVTTLEGINETVQIAHERMTSEVCNCYAEMLREVDEALRILYEKPMSGLSIYYTPSPSELNEGPHSQWEIPELELWSSSIETLSKPNEAIRGVEPFSELVSAVESNNLLKEYGSPTYGRAVGFSLN